MICGVLGAFVRFLGLVNAGNKTWIKFRLKYKNLAPHLTLLHVSEIENQVISGGSAPDVCIFYCCTISDSEVDIRLPDWAQTQTLQKYST